MNSRRKAGSLEKMVRGNNNEWAMPCVKEGEEATGGEV